MRGQRGYSLIELAVVLAVGATVLVAAWKLAPLAWRVASGEAAVAENAALQSARRSLVGFALREHRLPCPDTDGDGAEDCGGGQLVGRLPAATLGMGSSPDIRYGVFRDPAPTASADADLAAFRPRFSPTLLDGTTLAGPGHNNGLDFCLGLMNAMEQPPALSVGGDGSGLAVAFALALPGRDGSFAAGNEGPSFLLPGRRTSSPADDRAIAVGLGELSTRLGCARQLAHVRGAIRAFNASHDLARVANLNEDYRAFGLRVRKADRDLAAANVALATAGVGKATGSLALAISNAAITKGASAAIEIPIAVAGLVEAAANLVDASLALDEAIQNVQVAGRQLGAARDYASEAQVASAQALAHALEDDKAGLLE